MFGRTIQMAEKEMEKELKKIVMKSINELLQKKLSIAQIDKMIKNKQLIVENYKFNSTPTSLIAITKIKENKTKKLMILQAKVKYIKDECKFIIEDNVIKVKNY